MKIAKIFNNSVVLCVDDSGREIVVLGRGVGFQTARGAELDEALVEKRFIPGVTTPVDRLAAYLQDIPARDIDLAEEIMELARTEFGQGLSEHAVFPLADHVSVALYRVREGIEIDYPLQWEVASLYPRELAFSRRVIDLIAQRRGVSLPELESVPLALHFVNAQLGSIEISETMKITAALTEALATASKELGVTLAHDSADVARFVTHVRYLIIRRMRDQRVAGVDSALGDAIRDAHPRAYAAAERIADELNHRFSWQTGDDERFYLALHAARLLEAAE